jgi:CheY-like chemotaxis protein
MNMTNAVKATILVADDDTFIQKMIKAVLEERGYTVFTANDGNQALELLERERNIDAVITDIMMPGKEGIGLIRSIRRNFGSMKIIALTAAINYETILNTAKLFGADLTIKKPFDIDEFIDDVDMLVAAPVEHRVAEGG